jgi:hypothetical protein
MRLSQNEAVQLHPNPVYDQLTIQVTDLPEGSLSLQIADLSGRSVMEIQGDHEMKEGSYRIPLSVSTLPAGTYLVKVVSENGIATKPFVKL